MNQEQREKFRQDLEDARKRYREAQQKPIKPIKKAESSEVLRIDLDELAQALNELEKGNNNNGNK